MRRLFAVVLASTLLSACGLKGPLYLPTPQQEREMAERKKRLEERERRQKEQQAAQTEQSEQPEQTQTEPQLQKTPE